MDCSDLHFIIGQFDDDNYLGFCRCENGSTEQATLGLYDSFYLNHINTKQMYRVQIRNQQTRTAYTFVNSSLCRNVMSTMDY